MAEEAQKNAVQLAEQVAEGFAALSGEYQILFDQHKQLESKLSRAKQQYLDLLKRFTPDSLSQDHITFLQDLERVGDEQPRTNVDLIEQLAQCDDVERKGRAVALRQAEIAAASLRSQPADPEVKIWSGPLADQATRLPQIQAEPEKSPLEKDFTIAGTPSKLACPFASTTSGLGSRLATPRSSRSRSSLRGRRSKRPSFTDPIRAEICGMGPPSASVEPSVAASGSAAVCPIRFLDQHDPEEVAKYFEKHKHELPRSHEVCITRFQSNQESIEQLDRKYGNLVNMIQGLGQKHQAWLPEEPEDALEEEVEVEAAADAKADAKVEKWAKAVSASLQEGASSVEEGPIELGMDDARTAQFDRPMNEVRVGESPSRPWGITIPPKYTDAYSSSSVGSAPTASPPIALATDGPIGETAPKTGKCPLDQVAMGKTPPEQKAAGQTRIVDVTDRVTPASQGRPQAQQQETKIQEAPKAIPQMVFNGPVFLGYPPDQLLTLLQNSNLGSWLG
ncbi:hypothetical protein ACEQ8H_003527 [Pleosporales sp. CAS-2024a]